MAHKHTCIRCDRVIAEGSFDCDYDKDHDFAHCDPCSDEIAGWHREHHGHNVISEGATTLHCVNCQSYLEV